MLKKKCTVLTLLELNMDNSPPRFFILFPETVPRAAVRWFWWWCGAAVSVVSAPAAASNWKSSGGTKPDLYLSITNCVSWKHDLIRQAVCELLFVRLTDVRKSNPSWIYPVSSEQKVSLANDSSRHRQRRAPHILM